MPADETACGEHDPERVDGFTVIEVTITMAILLAVLAMVLGLLMSLTVNENRTQALIINEQEVRFVMNDFARDLRGANPVTVFTTTTKYRNTIQMQTGPTAAPDYVRWSYDAAAGTVTRAELNGPEETASVKNSAVRLQNVKNQVRGVQFLQYFNAAAQDDGDELVAANELPENVANCVIRVRMTITADSEPGPEPFTESQDVHVRNKLPGAPECPS